MPIAVQPDPAVKAQFDKHIDALQDIRDRMIILKHDYCNGRLFVESKPMYDDVDSKLAQLNIHDDYLADKHQEMTG